MRKKEFYQGLIPYKCLWMVCFIIVYIPISAQRKTLYLSTGNWSNEYKIDTQEVSKKYFQTYMASNDVALKTFKKGHNNKILGDIISSIGAGLIGYNIGQLMTGGEKNYTIGGVGLGLFVVGLPISNYGDGKMKKSVLMFNNDMAPVADQKFDNVSDHKKNISVATSNAYDAVVSLHNSGLVVRISTQSNKIKYLKKTLADPSTSKKIKPELQKKLNETIKENNVFFNMLNSGFKKYYQMSSVYFVPDSLYKVFLNGRKDVFINDQNEVDPAIAGPKEGYFLMQSGSSIEQLLLVNQEGNKVDNPFPYKKRIFLPSFKKLGNRQKYVHDQIKWFDEQLNELMSLQK